MVNLHRKERQWLGHPLGKQFRCLPGRIITGEPRLCPRTFRGGRHVVGPSGRLLQVESQPTDFPLGISPGGDAATEQHTHTGTQHQCPQNADPDHTGSVATRSTLYVGCGLQGVTMSHFTKIRTTLVDGDLVEEALRELGHRFERGAVDIRGYVRQTVPAEFRISTQSSSYDIGLVKNKGAYEVVADWYGVRGVSQTTFVESLNRVYSVISTKKTLVAQGFNIVSETSENGGATRIVLRRIAL